jgi:hypothetical protein
MTAHFSAAKILSNAKPEARTWVIGSYLGNEHRGHYFRNELLVWEPEWIPLGILKCKSLFTRKIEEGHLSLTTIPHGWRSIPGSLKMLPNTPLTPGLQDVLMTKLWQWKLLFRNCNYTAWNWGSTSGGFGGFEHTRCNWNQKWTKARWFKYKSYCSTYVKFMNVKCSRLHIIGCLEKVNLTTKDHEGYFKDFGNIPFFD